MTTAERAKRSLIDWEDHQDGYSRSEYLVHLEAALRRAMLDMREACALAVENLNPVHPVFQSRGVTLSPDQQAVEAIRALSPDDVGEDGGLVSRQQGIAKGPEQSCIHDGKEPANSMPVHGEATNG